jgi:hypothetical protein
VVIAVLAVVSQWRRACLCGGAMKVDPNIALRHE